MEKTNYQKYLEYVGEWFKAHSLTQRIDLDGTPREHPLTMLEWLEKNGLAEQTKIF